MSQDHTAPCRLPPEPDFLEEAMSLEYDGIEVLPRGHLYEGVFRLRRLDGELVFHSPTKVIPYRNVRVFYIKNSPLGSP